MLLTGEQSRTDAEPMASLLDVVREMEQQPGILNAELFIGFAWQNKAWWIVPIILVLLLLALLTFTGQTAAPFIYTLF